ncbi:hypothetical protein [Catellatospora sichuanensis]|uniref:hypothetical protein n=1 Tax=Catellatospora sichuanensis TaxID=1969805 RepID=UPI001182C955|nr:hypothetical protein [Catellatospora sichuanensis]
MTPSDVYEERYRPTPKTRRVIAISFLFTAALLVTPVNALTRILGLALFGVGGVIMAIGAFSRKVALRVDGTGITLGGSPLRHAATTAHVPWAEAQAVVRWRQELAQNLPWIGVLRPHDAPPVPGTPTGPAGKLMAGFGYAVSGAPDPRLVAAGRAINGWRLDLDRLTTAGRHHAPDVDVHDMR